MAKQQLDRPNVGTCRQQVGSKRVSEGVDRRVLGDARLMKGGLEGTLDSRL
jgi:hypothetical protein